MSSSEISAFFVSSSIFVAVLELRDIYVLVNLPKAMGGWLESAQVAFAHTGEKSQQAQVRNCHNSQKPFQISIVYTKGFMESWKNLAERSLAKNIQGLNA